MLTRLGGWLQPPIFEGEEEKTRVAAVLHTILLVLAIGTALMLAVIIALYGVPVGLAGWLTVALFVVVGLASLAMIGLVRRGRTQLVGWLLCFLMWVGTSYSLYGFGGLLDVTIGGYFVILVLAALVLGGPGILVFTLLALLGGVALFYGEVSGFLEFGERVVEAFDLIAYFMVLGLTALFLRYPVRSLTRALDLARGNARALNAANLELAASRDRLATQTAALERRARYLEATADIAQEVSSVLDLEALLSRVVGLITDRFEAFRLGIFLLDPSGEWAILRAASGESGQQLLARNFRIRMEDERESPAGSIVAHVIRSGRPYVAPDVSQDPLYLEVEEIAGTGAATGSELMLPLRARGEVLGTLSVQSPQRAAFGQEDVIVMQTVADQVALAISNAQLFLQAEEGLEAERRAYGELSREAWRKLVRTQPDLAVLRDEKGISPLSTWLERAGSVGADEEVEQALRTGRSATGPGGAANLAVPIVVRGHVIGAIDAHKPAGGGDWTPEQIALLETLSEQVGDALEGARLYEEAQRRAARDRLTYEIADKMRSAVDMDALMKITIQETAAALGVPNAFVQVATPPEPASDDGGRPEP